MPKRDLDPYHILGLAAEATPLEIRRAFRKLASEVHPDVQPPERKAWAEEQMRLVNRAYETLIDPVKRAAYDRAHPIVRPPPVYVRPEPPPVTVRRDPELRQRVIFIFAGFGVAIGLIVLSAYFGVTGNAPGSLEELAALITGVKYVELVPSLNLRFTLPEFLVMLALIGLVGGFFGWLYTRE